MRILVLGLNYAPESIGTAVYTRGLCEALAEAGHMVRIVAGKPYYPQWRIAEGYRGWRWRKQVENGVEVVRCPLYVPANLTGLRRILHYTSFAVSSLLPMLSAALRRPQIVIAIAPALMASPSALIAAKVARARTWLHVQDFEVDAAFATGYIDEHSKMARFGKWIERALIGSFDHVSTIGPEMRRRLTALGVSQDRSSELRNWAEPAVIPLDRPSGYREKWGIRTPHVALYSGNIAQKQGIEIVLEAAERLRGRGDLTFVVCGQGPNRVRVEAAAKGLPNIQFHDLQPTEQLGELLGLATIHLLPQKAAAADLVLPSKLTNMLASGRPVVATAAPGTGLAREATGCGILVEPGNAVAFADAITRLCDDPVLREALGREARVRMERVWRKERILGEAIAEMGALAGVQA